MEIINKLKEYYLEDFKELIKNFKEFKKTHVMIINKRMYEPLMVGNKYIYIRINEKQCYKLVKTSKYMDTKCMNIHFYFTNPDKLLFYIFLYLKRSVSINYNEIIVNKMLCINNESGKLFFNKNFFIAATYLINKNISYEDIKYILDNFDLRVIPCQEVIITKNKTIIIRKYPHMEEKIKQIYNEEGFEEISSISVRKNVIIVKFFKNSFLCTYAYLTTKNKVIKNIASIEDITKDFVVYSVCEKINSYRTNNRIYYYVNLNTDEKIQINVGPSIKKGWNYSRKLERKIFSLHYIILDSYIIPDNKLLNLNKDIILLTQENISKINDEINNKYHIIFYKEEVYLITNTFLKKLLNKKSKQEAVHFIKNNLNKIKKNNKAIKLLNEI